MKVKNLYFGRIKCIMDVEETKISDLTVNIKKTIGTQKNGVIFLKLSDETREVKDIKKSKIYEVKSPRECRYGDEFVTDLEQDTISEILGDYPKKHISKRKILKLYDEYRRINKMEE